MQASTRPNQGERERRGIVLVLILGVLALMAVIGVAFATFSGQSRISARNFAQSVNQPQSDELMDYALEQLIGDTADIRSAIRGHSMARDMYGNDGNLNGYLTSRPDGAFMPPGTDPYFYITGVSAGTGKLYNLTTNIPANDPAFYGYSFTRWTLRVSFTGTLAEGPPTPTGVVSQSLEVLVDTTNNGYRAFTVNIAPTDAATTLVSSEVSSTNVTTSYNTQLPGTYLQAATSITNLGTTFPFILDGRWLHAFNGPGMTTNAVYANFRYNGPLQNPQNPPTSLGNPNLAGMDEDYDAVDLENWFLAMQSADGSVIIPSFHRPAAIRIDTANGYYDWGGPSNTTPAWADSASRILRPRQADGHDAGTFPDLVPNASTGKITYDVDNDGDGQTDSVWVDLGYPARRNAQGQLYKPLFAFMVIGLNGRIPLNTAGNLAGGGPGSGGTHAAHLGNSVSEIDPTYALQNGYVYATDYLGAFTPQIFNGPYSANNTQVDNSSPTTPLDVRLIQLRNLLAGTRPQQNPTASIPPWVSDPNGQINGDNNFVMINGGPYFMPNSIADIGDVDGYGASPPSGVIRSTPSVAGRWGEAQAVPGYPYAGLPNPNPPPPYLNLVTVNYNNRIRAGFSLDMSDYNNGTPRDVADDNLNSFDPYPPIGTPANPRGEVGDLDFLDLAGAFLLPVERIRRFVTPGDINGTGRIVQWDGTNKQAGPNAGADQWGRVQFSSYFRPPGLPGLVTPSTGATPGAVTFPWTSNENYPTTLVTNNVGATPPTPPSNSNPLHGFEAQRFPNLNYVTTGSTRLTPQLAGGVPIDLNQNASLNYLPGTLPTYDASVNGKVNSDGLNEADEMNLYVPNALLDSPFGYGDLEWLYRQQDVDGGSLVSRLAQLAPVSFSNPVDGLRRRRLFALDSWEMNNFAWTNDNPGGSAFAYNARFTQNADAGFTTLNVPAVTNANIATLPNLTNAAPSPTPSLAQRDKKINLNYPLPVSNDPNEPVRQKWISDTYQTLKAILPPRAVDTAEELAQLSQYVINIIDFRDTDATMTHWTNPDVYLRTSTAGASSYPVLAAAYSATTDVPLDQYGMEYNPVAINEVMAYSFASTPTTNRFFIELVNTLTSPELGTPTAAGLGLAPNTGSNNASVLDLAGFQSSGAATPWDGGCWDLVFTDDLPQNRPDPVVGQLQPGGTQVGLIPLATGATGSMVANPLATVAPPAGDPVLFPLPQALPPGGIVTGTTSAAMAVLYQGYFSNPTTPPWTYNPLAPYYFTTIGNQPSNPATESAPPQPTYSLNLPFDPVNSNGTPTGTLPPGVLPPLAINQTPPTYPSTYPSGKILSGKGPGPGLGTGPFFWVCLRRPANPFAGVSAANPMIVVDAMRFPFIESGPKATPNYLFSYQRLQPFRGGHAVPMPGVTGALDPRYGYSEQIAVPSTSTSNVGSSGGTQITGTNQFYHTLGGSNDAGGVQGGAYPGVAGVPPTGPPYTTPPTPPYLYEPWDYFPFNDRDFTSVAELLMVPGCPPGLFTKQFAEFAPSSANVTGVFSTVTPYASLTTTQLSKTPSINSGIFSNPFNYNTVPPSTPLTPHTFPYLVDKFFYTGASPTSATTSLFGDPTGDGWFKMFEFFEVPSQMIGAVGPVAQGTNFDWLRQDTKPGLINPNLIIDEEVFFSVFGSQQNFNQQLLSFDQLPPPTFTGGAWVSPTTTVGASPIPQVVTATLGSGAPAHTYPMNNVGVLATDRLTGLLSNRMKASFAQFLALRHGGSGFVFGYGSGATGQNFTVQTSPAYPVVPLNTYAIPADRPFHSLSYPDINYTVMRPAALPPSTYSDPPTPTTPPTPAWPPTGYTGTPAYVGDPGVRNPSLYQGFPTNLNAGTPPFTYTVGSVPQSTPASQLLVPPAIPVRRFFQPPDAIPNPTTNPVSNAGETGDPYINNLVPGTAPVATGGLPPFQVPPSTGTTYSVTDGVVNLFWVQGGTTAPQPPTTPSVPNPYLGVNSNLAGNGTATSTFTPGATSVIDTKQSPYFRTEMLQKVMNLTTVRTHQYAVWITVGFFEVKRQGDLQMAGVGAGTSAATLAFDILGPEIGASTGQTTRYRGFFLVDRTQLTGYDPNVIGSFRPSVVYRQTIE